jgi:hypothetical protein
LCIGNILFYGVPYQQTIEDRGSEASKASKANKAE